MFRLLALIGLLCFGAVPAHALSEIQGLVQYDCDQNCNAQCTGPQTTFTVTYRTLLVFQWKDHVRRLWLTANDQHFVLGDDVTCKFEGRPSFQFGSSPLGPPPRPACVCIGNQCNPPGCGP